MNSKLEKTQNYFLITISLLCLLGAIMVYSASYIYAKDTFGNAYHFILRQLSYLGIGLALAYVISKTKFSFWYKNSFALLGIVSGLIFLTLLVGLNIKGASRWLSIGPTTIQPGEFLKLTIIFAATKYFYNFSELYKEERIKYGIFLLLPLIFTLVQPDFGTFSIAFFMIAYIAFMSPFSRKWFYSGLAVCVSMATLILFMAPYRVQRLMTYLDPWKDPKDTGFQIIQSYLTFAQGHIFGQGIGNSTGKLFYLPESYNDFILSIIGEELGFIGIVIIVSLFGLFTYFGFKLVFFIKNDIKKIIAASLILLISMQSFLNMGVVLGLLPTKGLNLPFISYGGSSLVTNLVCIGFFFSILRSEFQPQETAERPKVKRAYRRSYS